MNRSNSLYKTTETLEERKVLGTSIEKISESKAIVHLQTHETFSSESMGDYAEGLGGVYDYSISFEKDQKGQWEIVDGIVNDPYSEGLMPQLMADEEENRREAFSTKLEKKNSDTLFQELKKEDGLYDYHLEKSLEHLQKLYLENTGGQEHAVKEEIDLRAGNRRPLNATAMKRYQDSWYYRFNPRWGKFPKDCTNYVSQVLHAGGAPFDPTGSYKWYYYNMGNRAPAWSGVNELRNYLINNTYTGPEGKIYSGYTENLKVGDLVQFRKVGYDRYAHAVIIHTPGKNPIATAHTTNRKDRLSTWSGYAGSIKIKTGYFD